MKKLILTLAIVNVILLSGCSPKDSALPKSVSDLAFDQNGIIPDLKKSTTPAVVSSINPALLAFGGTTFNLGITIDIPKTINNNLGEVKSMDVVAFYKRGFTIEKAVLQSNITSFPATVSYTPTDFYNAFNLLNIASDFTVNYTSTDAIRISTDVYYKNGTKSVVLQDRLLNGNFITSYSVGTIQGVVPAITPFVSYPLSCPIADASVFVGNFKVLEDENSNFPVGSTVILSAVFGSPLKFNISFASSNAIVNASTSNLVCTITATGAISAVVPNQAFNYGTVSAPNNITISNGTGSKVVNCAGEVSLKLNYGLTVLNKNLRLIRI